MRPLLSWRSALVGLALLPGCLDVPGRRDHLWLSSGLQGPTEEIGLPGTGLEVDQATSIAVTYLNVPDAGGLGWELGLRHGQGESREGGAIAELETWTLEGGGLWAGPSEGRAVVPFAGGGWALTRGTLTEDQGAFLNRFDDLTLGIYVHTGLWARLSESVGMGLDLRYTFGPDIEDSSNVVQLNQRLDVVEAALFLSWSF